MSETPRRPAPILVVAGNARQFADWCREHGLRERQDAIYVSSERALRGRQGGSYVLTGTWMDRRDIREIEQSLRIVGAQLRTDEPHPAP